MGTFGLVRALLTAELGPARQSAAWNSQRKGQEVALEKLEQSPATRSAKLEREKRLVNARHLGVSRPKPASARHRRRDRALQLMKAGCSRLGNRPLCGAKLVRIRLLSVCLT